MNRKREIWIDDVKVIACILVVLGHFFQSMTKSNILPVNDLYEWFNKTIYYFHVPLFFICSGYLYQRYSVINSVKTWVHHVLKKLLVLGIPYFTFSFATWILKTVFANSTNDQIGGLFEILFLSPTSPYWYLYCLFFLFVITPTFRNTKMAVIEFVVVLSMKTIVLMGDTLVYVISIVLQNEIWFVMGMCLSIGITSYRWKPVNVWISIGLGIVFVALSILLMDINNGWISFLFGVLACVIVVELVRKVDIDRTKSYEKRGWKIKSNIVFAFLSKYTMPIFVMHTLFAATFRVILLKIGIENDAVHVVCGIAISFIGPIVTAEIMKKMKVLEFFLYPGKFVKV